MTGTSGQRRLCQSRRFGIEELFCVINFRMECKSRSHIEQNLTPALQWILCDCEAIANLRFRHLGQFFMEPSDYYDAPINKVLHFIRSVGLIKG
jgi:hypothetical protein